MRLFGAAPGSRTRSVLDGQVAGSPGSVLTERPIIAEEMEVLRRWVEGLRPELGGALLLKAEVAALTFGIYSEERSESGEAVMN